MVAPNAHGPGADRLAVRPAEAAELLGVSERTLRDWTARGLIPSVKRGNVRIYRVEALREWLRSAESTDGDANSTARDGEE